MADQDLLHTAEIMKAALPYIDDRNRTMVEVFVKVFDLMGSINTIQNVRSLAACGFENNKVDVEGLLAGIRPVCSYKEREIVDRILNFFQMRKVFEMYNNMMETMNKMQEFGDFSFGDSEFTEDADTVASNFSGSNFEAIFNAFKNQSTDPAFTYQDAPDPDESKADTTQPNNKMFEALRDMLPPDKMSTFENLSMLLNSMSYDNNSKSDNSEENGNG